MELAVGKIQFVQNADMFIVEVHAERPSTPAVIGCDHVKIKVLVHGSHDESISSVSDKAIAAARAICGEISAS